MTVTPTTAQPPTAPVTGTTSSAADSTASSLASLTDNFQTFLSLLTTQLKNQDPLSPLDSNQFTQQLVQMSGVEQQIQSNALLKQIAGNTGTGISTAVSMIGKDVRAVTDTAALNKGQANWVYNLPSDASDLKLEIVDSAGKVVHAEAPSDMKAGDHTLSWNGKDLTGTQLPDDLVLARVRPAPLLIALIGVAGLLLVNPRRPAAWPALGRHLVGKLMRRGPWRVG